MGGRFTAVKITEKEAEFKLCKIAKKCIGKNSVPYIVTHDGRTIRYPHPEIHVNDSFATRQDNCVIIGSSSAKPIIALPSKQGLAQTLLEERDERLGKIAESEDEEEAAEDDDE